MHEILIGGGRHRVMLQMLDSQNGWCGLLTGGEAPHIGGVVMAAPRPSLTGEGQSCDLWITPVPGHKDTDVAAALARELCLRLGCVVTVSAGLHVDGATPEDIRLLRANCRAAGQAFIEQVRHAGREG